MICVLKLVTVIVAVTMTRTITGEKLMMNEGGRQGMTIERALIEKSIDEVPRGTTIEEDRREMTIEEDLKGMTIGEGP